MTIVSEIFHYLLPVLALILVLMGIIQHKKNIVVLSLWVALVSILIQYQVAGGEILGSYFDYTKAILYSLNFLTLLLSLGYLSAYFVRYKKVYIRLPLALLFASLITLSSLILINLWMNAYFIGKRKQGTPVLQVASQYNPTSCSSPYVFYVINQDSTVSYLCPNYYLLIPKTGKSESLPESIAKQFGASFR